MRSGAAQSILQQRHDMAFSFFRVIAEEFGCAQFFPDLEPLRLIGFLAAQPVMQLMTGADAPITTITSGMYTEIPL
jgi:hypothetical protein